MQRISIPATVAMILFAASQPAAAQSIPGITSSTGTVTVAPVPLPPPPVASANLINEQGVPNTTTPGLIGTEAEPSGLPGDSTRVPGFPGRIQ